MMETRKEVVIEHIGFTISTINFVLRLIRSILTDGYINSLIWPYGKSKIKAMTGLILFSNSAT